jgi:hypothetical protein
MWPTTNRLHTFTAACLRVQGAFLAGCDDPKLGGALFHIVPYPDLVEICPTVRDRTDPQKGVAAAKKVKMMVVRCHHPFGNSSPRQLSL